jgi:hypothetical protein
MVIPSPFRAGPTPLRNSPMVGAHKGAKQDGSPFGIFKKSGHGAGISVLDSYIISVTQNILLTTAKTLGILAVIPAHQRASTGGYPGGGAGSGPCGRDLSPRSRATSGFPVLDGHYDPLTAPCVDKNMAAVERREASAPSIALVAMTRAPEGARNASPGVPACQRHWHATVRRSAPAPFGASSPHGLRGRNEAKPARTRSQMTCRDGEALAI